VDDSLEGDTNALVAAIRAQGGTKVTTQHFATDHGWSDHRIALQAAIVTWLQKLSGLLGVHLTLRIFCALTDQ
jgi:uncharacterized protein